MTYFVTRVALKEAPELANAQLQTAMESRKFYRSLTSDDGVEYQLPSGEFFSIGDIGAADVHRLAAGAVASIGRTAAIVVCECASFVWTGLEKA